MTDVFALLGRETAPAVLGGLGELENRRERGLVGKTSLGAYGAGKGADYVSATTGLTANWTDPSADG